MLAYEFIDPEEQITSTHFPFVVKFLKSTGRDQVGWHYIMDITWIYSKIRDWPQDYKILDVGGGKGPLQFLLAEAGFHVTNVDMVLADPLPAYAHRYSIDLTTLPSLIPTDYYHYLAEKDSKSIKTLFKKGVKGTAFYKSLSAWKYAFSHDRWRSQMGMENSPVGEIKWIAGNLCNMPEISSSTFDAVVSLSALEHIPIELLDSALMEIRRVLKPNARWAITTSGTENPETWFHKPSQGYCFSSTDLTNRFGAHLKQPKNPDEILTKYRLSKYLHDNLAESYKKSGNNGMPWGRWDPKYIPVGLSK